MPKNIDITADRNQLQMIPVPGNSGILEHKTVADLIITQLLAKGFGIGVEEYRISVNKEIVQGVLHLNHPTADIADGMMLTWINSYDKTTGFRCEMGGYNMASGTDLFIETESKAFRRNSTDLLNHTIEYLDERIDEGLNNYKDFIIIRDKLKRSIISGDDYEKMMGTFFFKDAITSSQLIIIKNADKIMLTSTVWNMWLAVAETFKSSHPKAWFKQQTSVSKLLIDQYVQVAPLSDPAQTNIISQIESSISTLNDHDGLKSEPEIIETVELNEKPEILSLTDYKHAVKENVNIQAESLVEAAEPEEVSVPEPVDETPIFSLENYEPSEFPLPPEDLPMSTNPAKDEYSGTKQDGAEGQQEEVEDTKAIQEPEVVVEPAPLSVTSTVEEHLLSANPTLENRQESSITSGADEKESDEKRPSQNGTDGIPAEQNSEELLGTPIVEAIPLEDQVALSEVQPVSEAEKEVSKEPVVDEPLVIEGTLQPNGEFDNDSNKATLESPNFEF
jgi:hypothetical protein